MMQGQATPLSPRERVRVRGALPLERDRHTTTRQLFSGLMAGLAAACAGSGVLVLALILAYIVIRGAPALNLAFFTERPLPFGEVGGGVAPAILGTLMMLTVAGAIGIPVGIGTAIYLAEFGRGRFAEAVRFTIDLLAGLPSIVVGVFVWAFLVCQDQKKWTLMVWLSQMSQSSPMQVIFAALVLAALPTLLVFIFCQNIIMRGIIVPTEK